MAQCYYNEYFAPENDTSTANLKEEDTLWRFMVATLSAHPAKSEEHTSYESEVLPRSRTSQKERIRTDIFFWM